MAYKIRLCANNDPDRRHWIESLESDGFEVVDGAADGVISLSGKRGVQEHIRKASGYIFSGKLDIGEMFNLCSLIVGTQTLDADLHYEENGEFYRKPIVLFGDTAPYADFINQLTRLKNVGTIKQDLFGADGMLRTPINTSELGPELKRKVLKRTSVHGGGNVVVDPKYLVPGVYKERDVEMPKFVVCGFTSAAFEQPQEAIDEAVHCGEEIAKRGWGLISGIGKTGLMGYLHNACVAAGGWAGGSNCAHIIIQEGLPIGSAMVWIDKNIYERIVTMLRPTDAIIIGAGGRGGAGTLQEALACAMLILRGARLMTGKDLCYKPVIIDNQMQLWGGLIDVMEEYGLVREKHFHVTDGTEQTMAMLDGIVGGEIEKASIFEKINMPSVAGLN